MKIFEKKTQQLQTIMKNKKKDLLNYHQLYE